MKLYTVSAIAKIAGVTPQAIHLRLERLNMQGRMIGNSMAFTEPEARKLLKKPRKGRPPLQSM
jgi:hypothetical protein